MIIQCPDCKTRYRFDESRIPERGLLLRCTRCHTVCRAFASGETTHAGAVTEVPQPSPSERQTGGQAGPAVAGRRSVSHVAPALKPQSPSKAPAQSVTAPAVTAAGPEVRPQARMTPTASSEIERLARVVMSDIEVYNPDKAQKAIREGKFVQQFKEEIGEAQRMVKTRFPSVDNAVEMFDKAVAQICEQRRASASVAP